MKYSYHLYIWLLKYGSCWTEVASYGAVGGSELTCKFGFLRVECVVEKFFFLIFFMMLNISLLFVVIN